MEIPKSHKLRRQRQVVYLDPAVIRSLKREKGETDKSLGEIIEDALILHLDIAPAPVPAAG